MTDVFKDVHEFHTAFELPIYDQPEFPSDERRGLRIALLQEEYQEYLDAEEAHDLVEVADALADIIYIAVGTALEYGIPLERVFAAVHESNMAKLVDGVLLRHPNGKVKKPEGWKAPDIKSILDEASKVTRSS